MFAADPESAQLAFGDFYATVAQVLPVVLLALVWESRYFEDLAHRPRPSRRTDPKDGVRFWTKPRVRAYGIFVAAEILTVTGTCLLVLAGLIEDSVALRGAIAAGAVFGLLNLLWRVCWHLLRTTMTDSVDIPPEATPCEGSADSGTTHAPSEATSDLSGSGR